MNRFHRRVIRFGAACLAAAFGHCLVDPALAQSLHRPVSDGVAYELTFDVNECLDDRGRILAFEGDGFEAVGIALHSGHPNSFRRRSWAQINTRANTPGTPFVRAELVPFLVDDEGAWPLRRAPGFQSYLPGCTRQPIADLPPAHYPTVIFTPQVPDTDRMIGSDALLEALQNADNLPRIFPVVPLDDLVTASIAGVISAGWDRRPAIRLVEGISFPIQVSFDDPEDAPLRVSQVGAVYLPEATFVLQPQAPVSIDVSTVDSAPRPTTEAPDDVAEETVENVSDPEPSEAYPWSVRIVVPRAVGAVITPTQIRIEGGECLDTTIVDPGYAYDIECKTPPPYTVRVAAFRSKDAHDTTTIVLTPHTLVLSANLTIAEPNERTATRQYRQQLPSPSLAEAAGTAIQAAPVPAFEGVAACRRRLGLADLLGVTGSEIERPSLCAVSELPWPARTYQSVANCLNSPVGDDRRCVHRLGARPVVGFPGLLPNTQHLVPAEAAFLPTLALRSSPALAMFPHNDDTLFGEARYCFVDGNGDECCDQVSRQRVAQSVVSNGGLPAFSTSAACSASRLPHSVTLWTMSRSTGEIAVHRWHLDDDPSPAANGPMANAQGWNAIDRIRSDATDGLLRMAASTGGDAHVFAGSAACDPRLEGGIEVPLGDIEGDFLPLGQRLTLPIAVSLPSPFASDERDCFTVYIAPENERYAGAISALTRVNGHRSDVVVLALPGRDLGQSRRRGAIDQAMEYVRGQVPAGTVPATLVVVPGNTRDQAATFALSASSDGRADTLAEIRRTVNRIPAPPVRPTALQVVHDIARLHPDGGIDLTIFADTVGTTPTDSLWYLGLLASQGRPPRLIGVDDCGPVSAVAGVACVDRGGTGE